MELLTVLTLIGAAVVVVALVAGLVATLLFLRSIRRLLAELQSSLARAADQSAGLPEQLQALQEATAGSSKDLADAQDRLRRALSDVGNTKEHPDESIER